MLCMPYRMYRREIQYEELVLVRPIGEGSFGKVGASGGLLLQAGTPSLACPTSYTCPCTHTAWARQPVSSP